MNGSVFSTMHSAPDLGALPAGWAAPDNFFATETWWRTVLAAGMPADAEARFLLCADAVLLPLQLLDGGRTLQSLTNPYTGLYQPLLAPGVDAAALRRAGSEFGRFCRSWPTVRLDALADDSFEIAPLLAGARRAVVGAVPGGTARCVARNRPAKVATHTDDFGNRRDHGRRRRRHRRLRRHL